MNDKTEKWSHISVIAQWGFLKKKTTTKTHLTLLCKLHTWNLGCQNVTATATPSGTPSRLLWSPWAATFFLVSRAPTASPAASHLSQEATCKLWGSARGALQFKLQNKPQVPRLRHERRQVGQGWRETSFRRASSARGTPNTIFCWREEQRW